jgi:hypothetical protein
MSGSVEDTPDGVWFTVEDRRYRLLSPLRRTPQGEIELLLALHHGPGDPCRHQDDVNTSVADGRRAFAEQCHGLDADVIVQDLLALDAAVRRTLDQEAAEGGDRAPEPAELSRCGDVEEGEHAYYRVRIGRNGAAVRTPISSFVIVLRLRVWVDGTEALRADLRLAQGTFPDVTFERAHWHGRGAFLKALPALDLRCVATATEIQDIQGLVAAKAVPTTRGTRALGACEGGYWVTEEGVLGADGWIDDPPITYVPYGGVCPLPGYVRHRAVAPEASLAVAEACSRQIWSVHEVGVIGPMLGWFFATPFKPALQRRLGHFPILNCWGTRGGGKTSLLALLWRLFGVESLLLSCTETEFALLSLLSSTTSIPLVFDEWKPANMRPDQVKRFERLLHRAYQGDAEHRGRPDLRLIPYRVTAPVAVAGEVPVAVQSALVERVIPVSPSPRWLAAHPEARQAFRELMALPLPAFAPLYVLWCLRRDAEADLARAERALQDALGDRVPPGRVRDNLLVIAFGLGQLLDFGDALGLPRPAGLDLKAVLAPALEQLCGPDGGTRTAADLLLEHLATLAETGRLRRGQHYALTTEGHLALRLNLCLPEFQRYIRQTHLNAEVLTPSAYMQQLRENAQAQGYVLETSGRASFGTGRQRAVIIDRTRAEQAGLDLGGFPRR